VLGITEAAGLLHFDGGIFMNWDQIEGQWKQIKGKVREKWGKLTDDDLQTIGGRKDQFIGKLQERYGMSRERAERDLEVWQRDFHQTETPPRMRTSGGHQ
jgi:uncharacterized protein YjbJ (UPF0337 family)